MPPGVGRTVVSVAATVPAAVANVALTACLNMAVWAAVGYLGLAFSILHSE